MAGSQALERSEDGGRGTYRILGVLCPLDEPCPVLLILGAKCPQKTTNLLVGPLNLSIGLSMIPRSEPDRDFHTVEVDWVPQSLIMCLALLKAMGRLGSGQWHEFTGCESMGTLA